MCNKHAACLYVEQGSFALVIQHMQNNKLVDKKKKYSSASQIIMQPFYGTHLLYNNIPLDSLKKYIY